MIDRWGAFFNFDDKTSKQQNAPVRTVRTRTPGAWSITMIIQVPRRVMPQAGSPKLESELQTSSRHFFCRIRAKFCTRVFLDAWRRSIFITLFFSL